MNFLIEFSIEKSTIEVKNFNGPVITSSSGKNGAKAGDFGDANVAV